MKINKAKGFSLIEMMIFIAVLGVALIIAVPNFNNYNHNTNLKSAGRDLAGDILNIKQTAAAQGVYYKIFIDITGNNYTIAQGGPNKTDAYTNLNSKTPTSFASYITIDSTTYQPTSNPEIAFQPRGTISPGGSVTLKNDIGSTITITTNLMGKVSVVYSTH